jgi:hypothetical protein
MDKKEYLSPEFAFFEVALHDVMSSSPEYNSSYTDNDSQDWGNNPPTDPGDDINW